MRPAHGRNFARGLLNYVGVGSVLIVLIAYFGITQPKFLTTENFLLIAQGKPAEIRDHPKVQEVYFGSGKTFEKAVPVAAKELA